MGGIVPAGGNPPVISLHSALVQLLQYSLQHRHNLPCGRSVLGVLAPHSLDDLLHHRLRTNDIPGISADSFAPRFATQRLFIGFTIFVESGKEAFRVQHMQCSP